MRILILSEDGSKRAHDTLKALVKKMLQLVDPGCQTQRLDFEPADDAVAAIVRANLWKSSNARDRPRIVALRRQLATRLAEQPPGFVMFHVDGDCTWSERADSENVARFDAVIREKVRALLAAKHPDWSDGLLDRAMSRLRLLVPHYSVEAWVFQNTTRAKRICHDEYDGRDADRFVAWEADRAELDEVRQIKQATCLGSKHNQELAESAFPHDAAYAAGTSFAAAVDSLRECDDLCQAVRGTWHTDAGPDSSYRGTT